LLGVASLQFGSSKEAVRSSSTKSICSKVKNVFTLMLRHYSSWLLTNSESLVEQKEEKDSALSIQIKEFSNVSARSGILIQRRKTKTFFVFFQ
jgi:hypothetical protein